MVDYLVKLMEESEFHKCLRLAEQQLLKNDMSFIDLTKINMVICRCRLGLQDPHGAVISGELAVKMARDSREWDLLGRSLLNLGIAYVGTRRYDHALHQFYSYFQHLAYYTTTRRFQGAVWKNIGIAHQRKLETPQAIDALNRARDWFAREGIDYSAFSCTHDLINTHLQVHETHPDASLAPVEELLKAQRAMVQKYPMDSYFQGFYRHDQAAYYLHCHRYHRAIVCAMKAMEARKEDCWLGFHCNMVLHHCSKNLGDAKQALGYALAARVQALQGRYFELEFLASQSMADVIRQQGATVVRELDEEYQALGIDLGQYLSPAILKREQ